jgi:CHAT domain-containing protein/tetratricopeptide (TPR) repeat protein
VKPAIRTGALVDELPYHPRMPARLACLAALFAAWGGSASAQAPAGPQAIATALADAPDQHFRDVLLATVAPSAELAAAVVAEGGARKDAGKLPAAQALFTIGVALADGLGDASLQAESLLGLAETLLARGETPAAAAQFEAGLETARRAGAPRTEGRLLSGLAMTRIRQGERVEALDVLDQAMALLPADADPGGRAIVGNRIAAVYSFLGLPEESLRYAQEALPLARAAGDQGMQANVLGNIGLALMELGRHAESLAYLTQAADLDEARGDRVGLVSSLTMLGVLCVRQGDTVQALAYHRRALALGQELGLKRQTANAWGNVGKALEISGDRAGAREATAQALALFEALGDPRGISTAVSNLGEFLARDGDCAAALPLLERGRALAERAGALDRLARALASLSGCQGDAATAVATATEAVATARRSGEPDALRSTLVTAAHAQKAAGRPAESKAALQEAIDVTESLQAELAGGAEIRRGFLRDRVAPYFLLAEMLLAEGRAEDALLLTERARARVLLGVLQSGRARVDKSLTPDERAAEQRLSAEVSTLGTSLRRERQRRVADAGRIDALEKSLQAARVERDAFATRLYGAHPELRTLRGEAPALSSAELPSLVDAETAVLVYLVARDVPGRLLVLTRGGGGLDLRAYPLPADRAIGDAVRGFRTALAERNLAVAEKARALHDLLIAPAAAQIASRPRLVIVPDGPLWELPFQALMPRAGRYLVEDRAVSYVPSLTVLREMHARRRPVGAGSLLALANPTLGETVSRPGLALMGGEGLAALPDAEEQTRALAALYPARDRRVYVGAEAREDVFKREAGRHRLLHLATHGLLDDANPLYSQLVLAAPRPGEAEDGLLEAREILGLDLDADLAVLSACETGRGQISGGEGLIGLSWSFFVAGCPTTVVSQWKVESRSTSALMVAFHKELRAGRTRADALARAMRSQMRRPQWRHPFYWASFAVIGDGR